MLAGLALALRFIHYSDHHGHLHTGGTLVSRSGCRHRREHLPDLRAGDPQVPASGRDAPTTAAPGRLSRGDRVRRGERLRDGRDRRCVEPRCRLARQRGGTSAGAGADDVPLVSGAFGAEQGIGEGQVDEQRVGAEDQRGGAQARSPLTAASGSGQITYQGKARRWTAVAQASSSRPPRPSRCRAPCAIRRTRAPLRRRR